MSQETTYAIQLNTIKPAITKYIGGTKRSIALFCNNLPVEVIGPAPHISEEQIDYIIDENGIVLFDNTNVKNSQTYWEGFIREWERFELENKVKYYFSAGDKVLVQCNDDKKLLPLQPSLKLANHSPDGFSWGYRGSGPSQLALAVLLEEYNDPALALKWYTEFRDDFLLNEQGFHFSSNEVRSWIFWHENVKKIEQYSKEICDRIDHIFKPSITGTDNPTQIEIDRVQKSLVVKKNITTPTQGIATQLRWVNIDYQIKDFDPGGSFYIENINQLKLLNGKNDIQFHVLHDGWYMFSISGYYERIPFRISIRQSFHKGN